LKIQIIGFSGSGKSYLAKKLADHYDLPLLYIDTVQFYDDWKERNTEEKNIIVKEFLSQNEHWVIDGNYSTVAVERFSQSDLTIYLKYNRIYCYFQSLKRYLKHKGKKRESLGCIEKSILNFKCGFYLKADLKKLRINILQI